MRYPSVPRRLLLGLPVLAAGCASEPAPLPRLVTGYRHLPALRLNVAEIEYPLPAPGAVQVDATAPLRPDQEMRRMAEERLVAAGTTGSARFLIRAAEFRRERLTPSATLASLFGEPGERQSCRMALRLELRGPDGAAGEVEAEARRTRTLPDGASAEARRRAAEELVRQAMDDLNVEFEFQLRRALRDWLVEVATPPPGAVEREELGSPRPR